MRSKKRPVSGLNRSQAKGTDKLLPSYRGSTIGATQLWLVFDQAHARAKDRRSK
jgi:hypothetical protein